MNIETCLKEAISESIQQEANQIANRLDIGEDAITIRLNIEQIEDHIKIARKK